MKLSQIIEASNLDALVQKQVNKLIALDIPDWKLAGRLAVNLQQKGFLNAAKAIQRAATDEDAAILAPALKELLRDTDLFPKS